MEQQKVLIVDDEQTNVALIKAAIKDLNFEILVATDGEQGLHVAQNEVPDLIILDVMMPKLNGFKVCGLLKADRRFHNIPIFILSSRAGDDDIELSKEVGADIYMLKPIDQEKLSKEVKRVLNL